MSYMCAFEQKDGGGEGGSLEYLMHSMSFWFIPTMVPRKRLEYCGHTICRNKMQVFETTEKKRIEP